MPPAHTFDDFTPHEVSSGKQFQTREDMDAYLESMPPEHHVFRFWISYTRPPTPDEIESQRKDHADRRSRYIEGLRETERMLEAQAKDAADRLPGVRREIKKWTT